MGQQNNAAYGASVTADPNGSPEKDTLEQFDLKCPPHTTEQKLMSKVDFRLLPILVFLYVLAFLDRVNISNALTLGLPEDLGLEGEQPNIALAIFFVPYVLFEIPSNFFLKLFSPHVWISGCITFFGVFMLGQGFATNYSTLLATRFFLGLAEAGMFPGCFYLISFYYKREESQRRFTYYFNSATIAAAFGSLIASGIARIDGARGLPAWRWIFIIEGAITIFCGMLSYFIIVDFPVTASWLREDEREFILARIRVERDTEEEPITLKAVAKFFLSLRRVIGAFQYFGICVPLYSFTYFAPTIIKELGIGTVQTQLHTVPPFAAAIFFSIGISLLSDKLKLRYPFLLLSVLLPVAGVGILQGVQNHFATQYAALFLVVVGTFTAGPLIICWNTMNMRGHLERSVGTAWIIGFGNIGGLVATFTLPTKDAPYYHTGYAICQACACLAVASSTVYFLQCLWENRKLRAKGEKNLYML